ncbi:MAG: sigma-70 family RNA polymerase sigma factor [Candidatus Riflebacteria bacterium]|nr:sigma-70 family RNA polymerase sigma factor [Candidatus Riflebacteria bacterium]
MYCYQALHCTKEDCPVRRRRIRHCWEYFQEKLNREPNEEECPFSPCSNCHYRMGWEIGLITDEVFEEEELPDASSLVPYKRSEQSEKLIPDENEKLCQISKKIPEDYFKDLPKLRFCWEITKCNNLECPVRQQRIIRCFKFFEIRGEAEKQKVTKCNQSCEFCHYKHGWELGIINEGLFEDVIQQKRRKQEKTERINREGIIEIYLNEISKKPLSKEQEIELAKKLAGDKHASEMFLLANLKLVVRIASNFTQRGLSIMDLIQEGNLGLIRAIAKFDYTLGYKFSTYAAYWVRHYMQKALREQGRAILVPHHLLIVANKIRRTISEQENFLGRSPSLTELSKILAMEEEKILQVIGLTETPISIETRVENSSEDGGTVEYYLADKTILSPEEKALESAKREACIQAIQALPERLKEIIEQFYGFGKEELSLAEIGRRMGFSRERARQLLRQALEILQKGVFSANLKDFS